MQFRASRFLPLGSSSEDRAKHRKVHGSLCPAITHRSLLATLPAAALLAALAPGGAAQAQTPSTPTYSATFNDAVTGDNAFVAGDGKRYYDVDAGADVYQNDVYERPTIQTYEAKSGRYGSAEYFGNLDIVQAQYGYDANFLYTSLPVA